MTGGRSLCAWCIDHPVATVLLTLALVLLGGLAFTRLAIAPLPEADFPTIQVNAQLPGASPQTMASSVATPLEVQFSAIPGMTQMTSSSALGSTNLILQFSLSKASIPPRKRSRQRSTRRPGACRRTCPTCRPGARSIPGQSGVDPQRELGADAHPRIE